MAGGAQQAFEAGSQRILEFGYLVEALGLPGAPPHTPQELGDDVGGIGVDNQGVLRRPHIIQVGTGGIVTAGPIVGPGVNLVDGPAGTVRPFSYDTAGVLRWQTRENATPETGGDAGSDFELAAYSDAGVMIDVPLTVTRAANGLVYFARPLVVLCPGGPSVNLQVAPGVNVASWDSFGVHSWGIGLGSDESFDAAADPGQQSYLALAGVEAGGPADRWQLVKNANPETGADAGSNLELRAYTDAGVQIDYALFIVRKAGGAITVGRPIEFTQPIQIDGASGAAGFLGTLANAPKAGNPDYWLPIKHATVQGWVPWWHA